MRCVVMVLALGCASAPAPESPTPVPAPPSRAIEGEIHYASESNGRVSVWAVRPSDGAVRQVAADPGADLYPAGGTPALLLRARGGEEEHEEQLVVLAGRELRPIGPRSARVRNPSVDPAGRFVVVESDVEGFRELYRVELASGQVERLTHHPSGQFEPSVSPDGRRLALVSSRDGDAEVYIADADGRALSRLTHFHRDDWAPVWSPAGDAIAFLSDREGVDRVFLVRPDGTELRRLTPDAQPLAEGPFAWSPDGTRIAYVARDAAGAELRVTDVRGNALVTVARAPTIDLPAWSPDSHWLAFGDGASDLVVAAADGTATVYLSTGPGDDFLPRWF